MKRGSSESDAVRVGIVGVGRGRVFARDLAAVRGLRLVALCDTRPEPLAEAGTEFDVATYATYDALLDHDLDAVILANFSHQHAPLAIRALERGKHVLSETAACKTLAEGVALCRAVERSGRTYAFADNYPFFASCQELGRLYRAGEIGAVTYAEGEYNHPVEEERRLDLAPGTDHWRHWLPPTYYCSHALAPLISITEARPVSVNALSIVEASTQSPHTLRVADQGSAILVRTDAGAVFRLLGLNLGSIHRVRYEIHGERGLIATDEPDHRTGVRVHHEPWNRDADQPADRRYDVEPAAGTDGSAYWNCRRFAETIRSGRDAEFDVYRGVAMAAVGIQAWRSCLADGAPHDVPDFRDETARRVYESDTWSPFPEDAGPDQPAPSIRGLVEPGAGALRRARARWARGPQRRR